METERDWEREHQQRDSEEGGEKMEEKEE